MMPTETGLVMLSPEEQRAYARAAAHLRDCCEMLLDLARPITLSEWMFLQVAKAAVDGDQATLDFVAQKIEQRDRRGRPH